MARDKAFKIAGVISVVIIVGIFINWWRDSADLKFVELSSPKGFRALVLNTQSSSPGPLFGLSPQSPQNTVAPEAFCQTLFEDKSSPVLGDRKAKVDIVEFFDYRCPYCKELKDILVQLKGERSVRIIYKEWPILSEGSKLASRAALGAAAQGKYMEFQSQLMSARLLTTQAYVKKMAANNNLDVKKLFKDMNAPKTTAALERNAALAYELGVVGTPALVVGRTIVQGAISKKQLARLIDIEASSPQTKVC